MDSRSSQVDQLFAPWDRPDSPGCAIGIIKDGELIYARGYGMANLDYDIPLTPDSVFYFCSTSKQFAAASMLLLTQSGAVSLDDDIRKYVPEIPAFEEPITVRHLIHHTSGLRDCLELMTLAGEKVESIFDNRDVIEKLSRQKALNFPPGDQYQYSNSGYVLIAEIVARVSGKSLREFAAEKIFRPLGMDHTFWDDDHRQVVKNRVVSYSPAPGGGYWRFIKALETVGDGGLLTTVNDLVKWDRNFYDGTVGGPDFAAQMYTRGKLNNGETIFYAFGLGHEEYRGLHGIAHGGGLHGFRTEMFRFPEQRFTVICMTNISSMDSQRMVRRIADIYLESQFPETRAAPGIELPTDELAAKTGLYWNPETGRNIRLGLADGQLSANANDTRFRLMPISATTYVGQDSPYEVELSVKEPGTEKPSALYMRAAPGTYDRLPAVEFVSPSAEQLAAYAGEYYCDEISATCRVKVEGGQLFMQNGRQWHGPWHSGSADLFGFGPMSVMFKRDAGRVIGLAVTTARTRNVWFSRTRGGA